MGVTGSGKTTIGKLVAERLAWVFLEADEFHSPENIAKMRNGIPLTDADRLPWLDSIHARLVALHGEGKDVVLACSALKRSYRQRLAKNLPIELVYLKGSPVLIGKRLRERRGHFAGTPILAGQFADLEEPREAFTLPVELPPEELVRKILQHFSLAPKTFIDAPSLLEKLRWRLLPFLFLLYVVAYLDRINVGFAALQMKGQLGFSDAVYGLGAGIFFLGYFLFQVPANLALERVGARRWISALMICWGIISGCMFTVHSVASFYSLRFLLGAAEAGFFPGVIFYLRSWFPAGARAGVVALFMTAGPVSGVIGGVKVSGYVDLLDIEGRIIDSKSALKPLKGIAHDHHLQLTSYVMITPAASGACRLDTVTKGKTVSLIQKSFFINEKDRHYAETIYPMVQDSIREGIFLPRRSSPLCSRRFCGFWNVCEKEYGGSVRCD